MTISMRLTLIRNPKPYLLVNTLQRLVCFLKLVFKINVTVSTLFIMVVGLGHNYTDDVLSKIFIVHALS